MFTSFYEKSFFDDNQLFDVVKIFDEYYTTVVGLSKRESLFWLALRTPYYIHMLQQHIVPQLVIFRNLSVTSSDTHEHFNKTLNKIWKNNSNNGGGNEGGTITFRSELGNTFEYDENCKKLFTESKNYLHTFYLLLSETKNLQDYMKFQ